MKAKQVAFLKAMLEESTITGACKKAGINRSTAYKYLKNKTFKEELTKRRLECIQDSVRYLQSNLALCNETLVEIIKKPSSTDQVKINAINSIYNYCSSLTESVDILERLAELEKGIEENEDSN